MEDRKRTILAVIIVVVVLAAVLYSFSLTLFIRPQAPEVPDPNASTGQEQASADPQAGGIPVEVTPETVQLMVESLNRYESYSRAVSVTYLSGEETLGTLTAQVWVDGGWTRTDTTLSSGTVESVIVGDGQLWLWYDDAGPVHHTVANDHSADLSQRLPTYEDVLELDPDGITDAGYVERDGLDCVYVEFLQPDLDCRYRYWISLGSGLLIAAETEQGGELVYSMTSREITSPMSQQEEIFTLPDGTVLHS